MCDTYLLRPISNSIDTNNKIRISTFTISPGLESSNTGWDGEGKSTISFHKTSTEANIAIDFEIEPAIRNSTFPNPLIVSGGGKEEFTTPQSFSDKSDIDINAENVTKYRIWTSTDLPNAGWEGEGGNIT